MCWQLMMSHTSDDYYLITYCIDPSMMSSRRPPLYHHQPPPGPTRPPPPHEAFRELPCSIKLAILISYFTPQQEDQGHLQYITGNNNHHHLTQQVAIVTIIKFLSVTYTHLQSHQSPVISIRWKYNNK